MALVSSKTSPLTELSRTLSQKSSVPKQVEHVLREMIFTGVMKPGERIVETKIAKELGIAQPTVREALNALESERLVVRFANRGCWVAELSPKEINQIFRLRIELEMLAVDWAIENRSNWNPEEWLRVVQKMKEAARKNNFDDFYQWDLQFHRISWQLADNPFLERSLLQSTMPLFPFVFMKLFGDGALDLKVAAADHEKLAQAVVAQEKRSARQITRTMVEGYWKDVMVLLGQLSSDSANPVNRARNSSVLSPVVTD